MYLKKKPCCAKLCDKSCRAYENNKVRCTTPKHFNNDTQKRTETN